MGRMAYQMYSTAVLPNISLLPWPTRDLTLYLPPHRGSENLAVRTAPQHLLHTCGRTTLRIRLYICKGEPPHFLVACTRSSACCKTCGLYHTRGYLMLMNMS